MPLASFISSNKEGFFNNTVINEFSLSDGKKIPKGMKLVKAFKYFEEDKHLLEDIQNYASRIIQEDKITGTLCFSVHPLDFLSLSENTYNWRSCHALDGEYRGGNLSYMTDCSTFICYLKGASNQKLPHFPDDVLWNSKKWRVLLFMENKKRGLMAGRQYPFTTINGLNEVSNAMKKAFNYYTYDWVDAVITEYKNKFNDELFELYDNYIPIQGKIYKMSDIITDNPGSLQYDDLLYSTCYTPFYALTQGNCYFSDNDPPHWYIGGEVDCLCCGKSQIENSEYMRCFDCELQYGDSDDDNIAYCACCDSRIFVEDAEEVGDDGALVCPACADTQCKRCEACGNLYFNNEITYNREKEMYLCPWCSRDADEGKDIKRYNLRNYINF